MVNGYGRVGLYFRVSTSDQTFLSQVNSIEKFFRELPPEKRPTSQRIFQDAAQSGAKDNRPGFQTLIEACRNGEIDTVVVYRLDRLTRSTHTAIRTIMELDSLGVGFVATSQPVLHLTKESPFRLTMLAAFAEIAEIERTTIVARVREGLEAARKRGVRLGQVPLSDTKRQKILELREYGFSQKTIANQLGLGTATVFRVLKSEGLTGSRKAEESFC